MPEGGPPAGAGPTRAAVKEGSEQDQGSREEEQGPGTLPVALLCPAGTLVPSLKGQEGETNTQLRGFVRGNGLCLTATNLLTSWLRQTWSLLLRLLF